MNMTERKDLKPAPQELIDTIRNELRIWLKENYMWASANGTATSAIMEWRLQEQGYSLWAKED
jgi:hypothetical protein